LSAVSTDRAFGQFVDDELCGPLGIEDMYFGVPATVEPRLAIT
jgi:CubicO group peptidase (beta-lactamase class C family)